MNVKQEKQLLESLTDSSLNFYDPTDKNKFKNITLNREEDKKKYEEFCKIFNEFLYSDEKKWFFEKYPKFFLYYIINNTPDNIRKRLYFSYETIDGKTLIMISKLDEAEKNKKLECEIEEKMKDFNKKKGVKRIFEAMIKRKSILIGHNFKMDVLFTVSHLGDQLPNTLTELKSLLKSYFSAIYDTKQIFFSYNKVNKIDDKDLINPNLEKIYSYMKIKHSHEVPVGLHPDFAHTYTSNSDVYHEAAFDAYVTGCAYIWMTESMNSLFESCQNKIYMMRSIYSCWNLEGDEEFSVPNVNILLYYYI